MTEGLDQNKKQCMFLEESDKDFQNDKIPQSSSSNSREIRKLWFELYGIWLKHLISMRGAKQIFRSFSARKDMFLCLRFLSDPLSDLSQCLRVLTHLNFHFYTPWKRQKTSGFIEMEYWAKIKMG